jgi:DNA-binding SARP family transcriptional activator
MRAYPVLARHDPAGCESRKPLPKRWPWARCLQRGLWRLAMQAEGRVGLRDSVGQRYQQLRSLLDEQLGLEPERATRALYHELLGQR